MKINHDSFLDFRRFLASFLPSGNSAASKQNTKMRIRRKVISLIEMTEEEIRIFHDLMEKAREGQTTHYAEHQMENGTFLGVSVCEPANYSNHPSVKNKAY